MKSTSIPFNPNFIDSDSDTIVSEVQEKGYFVCEGALKENSISEIINNIDFDKILINENDAGAVTALNNKYLTHCLACSEEVYKIITSKMVLDICDKYFSRKYRLVNHRVYETRRSQHMPWHTDNNTQSGAEFNGKHSMRGLLFLFYLSDVTKNAFQFIEGSHKIASNYSNKVYLSESYVNDTYLEEVVTFKMKKGSLFVCDTHGLHRAEPFKDGNYKRTTLLFQVDEVGEEDLGHGEKNLLNTAYLNNLTPRIMDYLGFGYNCSYPAFPNSSSQTLPLKSIITIQKILIKSFVKAGIKELIRLALPGELLVKAKQIRWSVKSKQTSIN
jgi:hypothetical protein